ncbi:adenylate/guanylate cyclase domain-containing protein [Mesorhizobium sp. M0159]|uniref:adenylate/guanylate cyclase domain-containing protein n=1 Tax=Mesorhizobium sp. M0159 TaxID=2956900 RepID=UPI00333A921E
MHPITAYTNPQTDRVLPSFGMGETKFQRAIATIMFTDVEDSTGLASALGLVETTRFMIEHFTLTRQVVVANGGIVQNFTGDGVLALWLGSEMTPSETALKALAAVAELVPEISLGNAWKRSMGSLSRRIRIGLHSGEVMFVNDRQWDFSFLVGSEVNFARHVEQAGKRENGAGVDALVMVSGATLHLAGLATASIDPYKLVRLTPAELAHRQSVDWRRPCSRSGTMARANVGL